MTVHGTWTLSSDWHSRHLLVDHHPPGRGRLYTVGRPASILRFRTSVIMFQGRFFTLGIQSYLLRFGNPPGTYITLSNTSPLVRFGVSWILVGSEVGGVLQARSSIPSSLRRRWSGLGWQGQTGGDGGHEVNHGLEGQCWLYDAVWLEAVWRATW